MFFLNKKTRSKKRRFFASLSGGYHMERGGMPLHDTVRINCKKGATPENQGSAVKDMA